MLGCGAYAGKRTYATRAWRKTDNVLITTAAAIYADNNFSTWVW